MFLLNSCLDLFSAPPLLEDPLSRSYRVSLPSSLTANLSSALVYSTQPPVSVYGTGYVYAIVAFLGSHICRFSTYFRSPLRDRFFLPRLDPFACVPTVLIYISAGISTCCPSPTPLRPQLRSRLPQGRSALPWNPWIFGLEDSHLHLATHSGILSSIHSAAPSGTVSMQYRMLPYRSDVPVDTSNP